MNKWKIYFICNDQGKLAFGQLAAKIKRRMSEMDDCNSSIDDFHIYEEIIELLEELGLSREEEDYVR